MEIIIYLNYIKELHAKLESGNGLLQVLIGPSQVGKTTSVLKLIEDQYKDRAYYVSADKIFNSNSTWLIEQWHKAHASNKILFVDEIQKCENWAEVLKKLYDENKRARKKNQCVILGSSSLEIQKGLSESLTGRFQLTRAYHWNYSESHEGYDLSFEDFLCFGGYPGSYQFKKATEWADYVKNSIVATVVEKDILQFQNVKSPSLFRQAFDILIGYPAQEISYNKLLGQLQDRGNVELIKNYIHLYEGAFLLKALEKFSAKKIKTKSSSPKILPLAPCFWAIEVKSGRKRSGKGLEAFMKQFPKAQPVYIDSDNYFSFEKNPTAFLESQNATRLDQKFV